MNWNDEGYLLSKNNYDENSIIIEAFTFNHGKYSGIVYGGSSRKLKKIVQIGNKLSLNLKSKSEHRIGYFNIELIKPVSPLFFDDKKRSICILAASSILKILLPERQINKKIYESFQNLLDNLNLNNWIISYIHWELLLIKELGFETDFKRSGFLNKLNNNNDIKNALGFNKSLFMDNFILPNGLKFPISRNILEEYYS